MLAEFLNGSSRIPNGVAKILEDVEATKDGIFGELSEWQLVAVVRHGQHGLLHKRGVEHELHEFEQRLRKGWLWGWFDIFVTVGVRWALVFGIFVIVFIVIAFLRKSISYVLA